MPKEPQGQERPADVIGNAVRIMQIATGEIQDNHFELEKNTPARAASKVGQHGQRSSAKSDVRKLLGRLLGPLDEKTPER